MGDSHRRDQTSLVHASRLLLDQGLLFGDIEMITPTLEQWLADRLTGITATDAAVICGASKWKSPYKLYLEKRKEIEPDDLSDLEWIKWGNILEPVIARQYVERTGSAMSMWPRFTIARHGKHDWKICTPDATQWNIGDEECLDTGVLEIKTAGTFRRGDWEPEPPLAYQVQVQHQMDVLGLEWGTIAVLFGGQQFRWFDVVRDDSFIATMHNVLHQFWQRVQDGDPPLIDGSESTAKALFKLHPKDNGESIALPAEADTWDSQLSGIKAEIKELEAEKRSMENFLKDSIGDNTYGTLADGSRYSWKHSERDGFTVEPSTRRTLRREKAK